MTVVVSLPVIVVRRAALPAVETAAAVVSLLVTDETPADDNLFAIVDRSEETLCVSFNRLQDCGLDPSAICWLAPGVPGPEWLSVKRLDADRVKLEIRGYYPLPPGLVCPVMPV